MMNKRPAKFDSSEEAAIAIQSWLIKQTCTLSVAESCTGGELSACFTRQPGASDFFLGSIVAYSNEVKEKVLGVCKETLQGKGAVSEETACEMARGVLKLMHTDYSIGITGIAGPAGGTIEKPVGTVCMAICGRSGVLVQWTFKSQGMRKSIILDSVYEALTAFWTNVCRQL